MFWARDQCEERLVRDLSGVDLPLNAHFEDQAEHEYVLLVEDHHDWEIEPFESDFVAHFAWFDSLPDLFCWISYNE